MAKVRLWGVATAVQAGIHVVVTGLALGLTSVALPITLTTTAARRISSRHQHDALDDRPRPAQRHDDELRVAWFVLG